MLFSRLCRCGCSILFHAVPTNGGFSWNCVSRFTIQHCRSRQTVQSSENETSSDPRLTAHSKCHGFTRLSKSIFWSLIEMLRFPGRGVKCSLSNAVGQEGVALHGECRCLSSSEDSSLTRVLRSMGLTGGFLIEKVW